jgi:hypothetical protein
MMWLRDRASTVRDALTLQRVLALPIIFAIVTAAIRLAPVIAEREAPFLSIPAWVWGVLAFLIVLLYFVIEHATRLRLRLAPKLKLSFNPNEAIVQTPAQTQTGELVQQGAATWTFATTEHMASYVRIRVEAALETTVRGCTAFLIGLEKRTPPSSQFIPIRLPQDVPLAGQPFDVFPRIRCIVDFLFCSSSDNKLRVAGAWPLGLRDTFDDVATYRFTIAVNAEGLTETTRADIDWAGKWDTITGSPVAP